MTDSPHIVDVTRENYAELMEASFKVPVLIDFWASWCQPCQVLMPILAGLAEEYGGKFILGKLNTEEQQEIAAQFAIRSIPTIKLFRDSQPVDGFMGAMPEGEIRSFLDRYVSRESDTQVADARDLIDDGRADEAIAVLTAVSEADPDNARVPLALAEAYAAAGDVAAAEATLDSLPMDQQSNPQVAALRSHLFFDARMVGAPETPELEARLEKDPADAEALLQLAFRKVTERSYEAGMELLLDLMRIDRDTGREALLKLFELLGDDPLVGQYRRRMASLLN